MLIVPLFKGDLGGSGTNRHTLRLFKHPLNIGTLLPRSMTIVTLKTMRLNVIDQQVSKHYDI